MPFRIAVVTPRPLNDVQGGAENLWAGLTRSLSALQNVRADWIRVECREASLRELLESYQRFALLDLSGFDQVISTKYPAWAVRHTHHVVYMQHMLRGLYDTYPQHLGRRLSKSEMDLLERGALTQNLRWALDLASAPAWIHPANERAVSWALSDCPGGVAEIAGRLLALLTHVKSQPLEAFPGPFARACVRLLDAVALAPGRISRRYAISNLVAQREGYSPSGEPMRVIYHPTNTQVLPGPAQGRDIVLTASRLEHPKRIPFLLEAYRASGIQMPYWIVGDGPQRLEIESLAKEIPGVVVKGHLAEPDLVKAYQRALFVPFAPDHEDYGLITVEALLCGAAVLTTSDSGGPAEVIAHERTGLVQAPDVSALAEGFRRLAENPQWAAELAQSGARWAARLSWHSLATRLCDRRLRNRLKLVVCNTFPSEPTTGGGRLRIKGLYGALADHFDIHLLSLAHPSMPHHLRQHAEGLVEEFIPAEPDFMAAQAELESQVGVSCLDVAAAVYPSLLERYSRALARALGDAQAVVFSHPYCFPLYERLVQASPELARPVVYEAHNVEQDLKARMFGPTAEAAQAVRIIETRLLRRCCLLTGCSPEDLWYFKEIAQSQGFELSASVLVANGMEQPDAEALNPALTLSAEPPASPDATPLVALFMGSAHGPNTEAVEAIVRASHDERLNPRWRFVVLGSVGWPWVGSEKRARRVLGIDFESVVSEAEKLSWLAHAHVGLNPVLTGSGTNLKFAEYAVMGLPVLSTVFGARGGLWKPGQHYRPIPADTREQTTDALVASLNAFADDLSRAEARLALRRMAQAAQQIAGAHLGWGPISDEFAHALNLAIGQALQLSEVRDDQP
jgi:glycosyltransferase involved in cell wall biosynthesis